MIIKYYNPWIETDEGALPESFGIIDNVTNLNILKFTLHGYTKYTDDHVGYINCENSIIIKSPYKLTPIDKFCYTVLTFNIKDKESFTIWSDNIIYILNDNGKTIEKLG